MLLTLLKIIGAAAVLGEIVVITDGSIVSSLFPSLSTDFGMIETTLQDVDTVAITRITSSTTSPTNALLVPTPIIITVTEKSVSFQLLSTAVTSVTEITRLSVSVSTFTHATTVLPIIRRPEIDDQKVVDSGAEPTRIFANLAGLYLILVIFI